MWLSSAFLWKHAKSGLTAMANWDFLLALNTEGFPQSHSWQAWSTFFLLPIVSCSCSLFLQLFIMPHVKSTKHQTLQKLFFVPVDTCTTDAQHMWGPVIGWQALPGVSSSNLFFLYSIATAVISDLGSVSSGQYRPSIYRTREVLYWTNQFIPIYRMSQLIWDNWQPY